VGKSFKKKTMSYNKFWDRFDTDLYEDIVELNDTLNIRINKKKKEDFLNASKKYGGMSKVINKFIELLIEKE
jgi:hypothetical protein